MWTTKIKTRLSETLATESRAKLLGGLAAGALLMTATGLSLGLTLGSSSPVEESAFPHYPATEEMVPALRPEMTHAYYSAFEEMSPVVRPEMTLAHVPDPLQLGPAPRPETTYTYFPDLEFDGPGSTRLFVPAPAEEMTVSPSGPTSPLSSHQFMLNQGNASSPSLIDRYGCNLQVHTYCPDFPISYEPQQGKVGSPSSIAQTECYPDLQIC